MCRAANVEGVSHVSKNRGEVPSNFVISARPSVCPYGCMYQRGFRWADVREISYMRDFEESLSKKSIFIANLKTTSGTLHEDLSTFVFLTPV